MVLNSCIYYIWFAACSHGFLRVCVSRNNRISVNGTPFVYSPSSLLPLSVPHVVHVISRRIITCI